MRPSMPAELFLWIRGSFALEGVAEPKVYVFIRKKLMELFKIVYRNLRWHPVRSLLTALAAAVALFGFCMTRTLIGAWYSALDETSQERMIVRNAVSLVFYLPISYLNQIARVPGVAEVAYGNYFGGEYGDTRYQFAQFAVSSNFLQITPELTASEEDLERWKKERKGILVGNDVAEKFGLKVGDNFNLKGTLFPGLWEFNVSGIFHGRPGTSDERQCYFHWEYLNERNRAEIRRGPDHVGFFSIQLEKNTEAAEVANAVDSLFRNSYAETKTETETEFVKGFISMSSAIISALNAVSIIVIFIMLLIVSNTMLLSFREKKRYYAILKAVGFQSQQISSVIIGESLLLCCLSLVLLGAALSVVFSLPTKVLLGSLSDFISVFALSWSTVMLSVLAALVVAVISAISPILMVRKQSVAQGVRELA